MRFIPFSIIWLFYLFFGPCLGLRANTTHKLAIDQFLGDLSSENLQILEYDFIFSKLKDINGDVNDLLKSMSQKENLKYTLQKYKTKIKNIAEALSIEIKDSLDSHLNLLDNLNNKFQEINIEIVKKDFISKQDNIYQQNLLNYLNKQSFNKSIQFLEKSDIDNKEELINQLKNLLYSRHESQNGILDKIIILHKLAIEIELTKIVYLYSKNRTESREFESKLQKFVKMLHLLANFELFLNGCFNSPYEISITKIINLSQNYETTSSTDTRFVIYPNLLFEQEICDLSVINQNEKDILSKSEKTITLVTNQQEFCTNSYESNENISFNQSEVLNQVKVGNESSLLLNDKNDSLFDFNSLKSVKQNEVFNQIYNDNQFKVEIDIISPILSVESNKSPRIGDYIINNDFNQYSANKSHDSIRNTRETFKINDEEVKSHMNNIRIKQMHKNTIIDKRKNYKDSKLDLASLRKCFEYQYVCLLARHLEDDEILELDSYLFSYGVKLPLEKDSNLIWSISESLVDNFGARKRLIEHVSQKIIDFTLSIGRLNTDPLMNTGNQRNDQIGFYREKHIDILSILIALKEFLNSKNSEEISTARINFIDKFVPLIKRHSNKKIKFSKNSETNKKKSQFDLSSYHASSRFIKLRDSFDNDGESKYNSENGLLPTNISETISEPSLYELCTRFITTLSITKSVKSFNDNSYKFAQKVCSMIFEQPIHNILSSQDYAWLTGFTLVRTVNYLIKKQNLPEEIFIDHENALRALNYSFSQKVYNFHQACTQSLISQKSTAIYRNNISLHLIKPLMKISCAEYFGISVFLYEN
ncbi:putative signal peptide-containing protein [Cryptosporidium parvum]